MDTDQEIHKFKKTLKVPDFAIDLRSMTLIKNDILQRPYFKYSTKSVLNTVSNDFEKIDVLPSKRKKPILAQSVVLPEKQLVKNTSNLNFDINADKQLYSLVQKKSVMSEKAAAIICTKKNLLQNCRTVNVTSLKAHTPAQKFKTLDITPDGNANIISSMAKLADAEIVQTSNNSVSIGIKNPHLVKVLKNSEPHSANSSLSPHVSPSDFSSENVYPSPLNLYEEGLSANSINFLQIQKTETVYAACLEELPNKRHSTRQSATVSALFPIAKNTQCKSVSSRNNGNISKGRRISVKMKNEFKANSYILCPFCSRSYKTFVNFETHYKFCTGQKDVTYCPFCQSVILSSEKAVLHHISVEHPENLAEYKLNLPNVEDGTKKNPCGKEKPFQTGKNDMQSKEPTLELKSHGKRICLKRNNVEKEKVFEDVCAMKKNDCFLLKEKEATINTKSRLVLNVFQQYERYNENLKLTRDWSTSRRTYSKSNVPKKNVSDKLTALNCSIIKKEKV